jgi:hypothetical protein
MPILMMLSNKLQYKESLNSVDIEQLEQQIKELISKIRYRLRYY